jgi:hypothetical protein
MRPRFLEQETRSGPPARQRPGLNEKLPQWGACRRGRGHDVVPRRELSHPLRAFAAVPADQPIPPPPSHGKRSLPVIPSSFSRRTSHAGCSEPGDSKQSCASQ